MSRNETYIIYWETANPDKDLIYTVHASEEAAAAYLKASHEKFAAGESTRQPGDQPNGGWADPVINALVSTGTDDDPVILALAKSEGGTIEVGGEGSGLNSELFADVRFQYVRDTWIVAPIHWNSRTTVDPKRLERWMLDL